MPIRNHLAAALGLAGLLAAAAGASASEEASHENHGHQGEHHHANVLGVFGGFTHEGRRENEFALGLEYERRIGEHFGIGGLAEYTFGDADLWVYALPLSWHVGNWKLFVAPGVEDGDHGSEELVRLGGEYAFHLEDGWEISPQLNVDFVDSEDVWVFGVALARGF